MLNQIYQLKSKINYDYNINKRKNKPKNKKKSFSSKNIFVYKKAQNLSNESKTSRNPEIENYYINGCRTDRIMKKYHKNNLNLNPKHIKKYDKKNYYKRINYSIFINISNIGKESNSTTINFDDHNKKQNSEIYMPINTKKIITPYRSSSAINFTLD